MDRRAIQQVPDDGQFLHRGRTLNRIGILVGVVIAALLALIFYSTFSGVRWRVEACMSYGGRTACKTASGKSEKAALEAAVNGACADIASGVTDTINCQQSEPQKINWLQRH